jgi:hypothetical protein
LGIVKKLLDRVVSGADEYYTLDKSAAMMRRESIGL